MLASYFTMGKAYGWGIFMKCGVILGYYNLGPRALISWMPSPMGLTLKCLNYELYLILQVCAQVITWAFKIKEFGRHRGRTIHHQTPTSKWTPRHFEKWTVHKHCPASNWLAISYNQTTGSYKLVFGSFKPSIQSCGFGFHHSPSKLLHAKNSTY